MALNLNFLFDENIAIMNLDNMHWTVAENARKCAQKLFGQKWTKCLVIALIFLFFLLYMCKRLENIVDIEFVEHLTNCIGVTAPLLERRKTVQ